MQIPGFLLYPKGFKPPQGPQAASGAPKVLPGSVNGTQGASAINKDSSSAGMDFGGMGL